MIEGITEMTIADTGAVKDDTATSSHESERVE